MNLQDKINNRPFPHWGNKYEIGNSVAGEDMVMYNLLGKLAGTIVDVGANDGITGSNSFRLINEIQLGWTVNRTTPNMY